MHLRYPALHLYTYTALHQLLPRTDRVRPAQFIFLGNYLLTLVLVAALYYLSGRRRHYPQILLIPLTLSKRAHSIALLRLFNDPLAMVLLYASILGMMIGGKRGWRIGCLLYRWDSPKSTLILYSLALGIKMNILLFFPGLLVLLFQYRGIFGTIESIALIASVQVIQLTPLSFRGLT